MFSVIIPAFNSEKTIYSCLESVYNQTRLDLIEEIIIVDDGSVDRTGKEVLRFVDRHEDIKIYYIYQENKGASCARNIGIMKAKGDWIALLDSDDIWLPDKIERQYSVIESIDNISLLGASRSLPLLCAKKGNVYKLRANQLCLKSTPTTPSVVFRKDEGIRLGLFDESMKYSEDINFFQRFLLIDSYYVLCDELVKTGIEKHFFGEKGLSSNIKEMSLGRDKNTRQLYEYHLISYCTYVFFMILNRAKYLRRLFLNKYKIKGR